MHSLMPEIYSSIVNQMSEGVIYLDANDNILLCNPAAEVVRKVKAERIIGKTVFDIHPKPAHEAISELLSALKSGVVASRNRKIEAQGRYFDNSYSAIWGEDGKYQGTMLISRDISEAKRLSEENIELKAAITGQGDDQLVAESNAMKKVIEVVQSVAPLDSTVLVTGESGTGKEKLVDLLHRLGNRRKGPLVKVNCAALPENLLESELFGHIRGAFTGAIADQRGKFELAHGGTLFPRGGGGNAPAPVSLSSGPGGHWRNPQSCETRQLGRPLSPALELGLCREGLPRLGQLPQCL